MLDWAKPATGPGITQGVKYKIRNSISLEAYESDRPVWPIKSIQQWLDPRKDSDKARISRKQSFCRRKEKNCRSFRFMENTNQLIQGIRPASTNQFFDLANQLFPSSKFEFDPNFVALKTVLNMNPSPVV